MWPVLFVAGVGCSEQPAIEREVSIAGGGGDVPIPVPRFDVEEEFSISVPERLDWLFVVDNGPGSEPLQQALVDELPDLLGPLTRSPIDWRIAVVAADASATDLGALRPLGDVQWLTPESDLAGLAEGLALGASGTRSSATLAIVAALTGPEADGFLRADTPLQLIVVGSGVDDASPAELPPEGFDAWLEAVRPDASLHCLVTTLEGGSCAAHAEASGGAAAILEEVDPVAVAAAGLTRDFALSRWPTPDSLSMWVAIGEATIDFGPSDWSWTPESNTLSFRDFVPGAGSTVTVSYIPVR